MRRGRPFSFKGQCEGADDSVDDLRIFFDETGSKVRYKYSRKGYKEEPFVPSKGWAEMIRKMYEIDLPSVLIWKVR